MPHFKVSNNIILTAIQLPVLIPRIIISLNSVIKCLQLKVMGLPGLMLSDNTMFDRNEMHVSPVTVLWYYSSLDLILTLE